MSNASSSQPSATPTPSDANPRRSLWGIPAALLVGIVGFILAQVLAQIITGIGPMILGWHTDRINSWLDSPLANFIYVLVTEALTVGLLAWFIRRHRGITFWQAVGLRKPKGRDALLAIGGFVGYIAVYAIVLSIISSLLPINTEQEQSIGFAHNVRGAGLVMAFVSLVILPPLVEEIVFRGFLYGTLRRRNVSFVASVIIVSLLFASMHLFGGDGDSIVIWIAALDTFVLSLILCYLREKTGSIWASIGVHALKNTLVFVNIFIMGN